MEEDWEGEPAAGGGLGPEPEEIAESLAKADDTWVIGGSVELSGGTTWRPDAVRDDGSALLHVHVAERLRSYATGRFEQALEDGIQVHVATTLGRLYDHDLLIDLVVADAIVHIVEPAEDVAPRWVLAIIADVGMTVPPDVRCVLANHGLQNAARDGTADQKGKRFEAVVAFLLSQVDGFAIFSRNYKTSTEEIDAVIQRQGIDSRVWSLANAPFLLAEAKNHADGVSQAMYSAFRLKMLTKRQTVRIGLMLSRTTISGAAINQEAKFASDDLTVAFLDGETLAEWANADDGTAFLERLIGEAMLG